MYGRFLFIKRIISYGHKKTEKKRPWNGLRDKPINNDSDNDDSLMKKKKAWKENQFTTFTTNNLVYVVYCYNYTITYFY